MWHVLSKIPIRVCIISMPCQQDTIHRIEVSTEVADQSKPGQSAVGRSVNGVGAPSPEIVVARDRVDRTWRSRKQQTQLNQSRKSNARGIDYVPGNDDSEASVAEGKV